MKTETYLNIEYSFERRRYGTCKFFTWLNYRVIGGDMTWQSYGDPWPKPRLNGSELQYALAEIVVRHLTPGSRVRTILGSAEVVGQSSQPMCVSARIEDIPTILPLHPKSILEVLSLGRSDDSN